MSPRAVRNDAGARRNVGARSDEVRREGERHGEDGFDRALRHGVLVRDAGADGGAWPMPSRRTQFDVAATDFFVGQRGVRRIASTGRESWSGFGEPGGADELLLALEIVRVEEAEFLGDKARGAHADGDGLAVEVGAVAGDASMAWPMVWP